MTRFQPVAVLLQAAFLRLVTIPNMEALDWSILQDRPGRSRPSAIWRHPLGCGIWAKRMILSFFLLSAFFLGSPTSALLFLSIQQRTKSWLRPSIFILFWNENMITIVQTPIQMKNANLNVWRNRNIQPLQNAQAAWYKVQDFASIVWRPYRMCLQQRWPLKNDRKLICIIVQVQRHAAMSQRPNYSIPSCAEDFQDLDQIGCSKAFRSN